MNLFYLDIDPVNSARMHCDKHVVKMIVEYAQLMSTAHRVIDGYEVIEKSKSNRNIRRWKLHDCRENILYKSTHVNHPSAVWVRKSIENYRYTFIMFSALLDEFEFRFGKTHKTAELKSSLSQVPYNLKTVEFTEVPQAMPEEFHSDSFLKSYREYYRIGKSHLLKYTKREQPYWLTEDE